MLSVVPLRLWLLTCTLGGPLLLAGVRCQREQATLQSSASSVEVVPPREASPEPDAARAPDREPNDAGPPSDAATGDAMSEAERKRELKRRMEAFGRATRVEDEEVGLIPHPSATWALYRSVVDIARPSDIVEALRHKNPVVRVYLGRHVVRYLTESIDDVLPLLRDVRVVKWQSGCVVEPVPVDIAIVNAVCDRSRDLPDLRRLLLDISTGHYSEAARRQAVSCLGQSE